MPTKKTDPRDELWADRQKPPPPGFDALQEALSKDIAQAMTRADDAAARGDEVGTKGAMEEYRAALGRVRDTIPLVDAAMVGQAFKTGRKVGAGSPVRRAIALALRKTPALTTAQLWNAIASKPPKGWEFCDNAVGKYADGPAGANMSWARFQNVCSEERKKQAA